MTEQCAHCGHEHHPLSCQEKIRCVDQHGEYWLYCHCRNKPRPDGCHCDVPCHDTTDHLCYVTNQRPYFCTSCLEPFGQHTPDGKCLYGPGVYSVLKGCRHCREFNGVRQTGGPLGYSDQWGSFCDCPLGLRVMRHIKRK